MIGKGKLYLHTDHSGLNKFTGEDDENYQVFIKEMEMIVNSAWSSSQTGMLPKARYKHHKLTATDRKFDHRRLQRTQDTAVSERPKFCPAR